MTDGQHTALVVLDEDGDTRGWINEHILAAAYVRNTGSTAEIDALSAMDIMDEQVPECPSDLPLAAAVHLMADQGVDHVFFLHRAGGRVWPSSVLSLRDVVKALAGPEYIKDQGTAAPRLTPMDLFRQRYGLPNKKQP